MRVSKEKQASNRAALLTSASSLLKRKGFGGAGVIEISGDVGLSQGAVYAHFSDKDALLAEACRLSVEVSVERWKKLRGDARPDKVNAFAEAYLSDEAVNAVDDGCPVPAFGSEVFRQSLEVATAFSDGLLLMVDQLEADLHAEPMGSSTRGKALFIIAAMSGAVSLVRSLSKANPALANEMLKSARQEIEFLIRPSGPEQAS